MYGVGFLLVESEFMLEVRTNYMFYATNEEVAESIAKSAEIKLSKNLIVYYYKDEIILSVEGNTSYDSASICKYIFYDKTKGEYLTTTFKDGTKFYTVWNPVCLTELTKEEFITLFKSEYEEYLNKENMLSFESVAYFIYES